MSNRTIEAILRISSKLGSMQALKTLQRELKAVDSQAQAYNRTQGMIYRGASALGPMITRFAGPAALGYLAYDVTRTGMTIEKSLFNIKKKAGATKEEMSKIKQEIMDLSRELPVAIEEIASAYERGAAAGVPLDELREFAKLSAQVADAWDMTAEDTSNAFAGFKAAFGIEYKDMEKFADLINFLADSGIADESGIVEFLDRVGASLKNFGLTPEQSAAFGAAMLNLKMAPEVAARAMDTLTGKLLAPENLAEKPMQALQAIVGDIDKFAKLMEKNPLEALMTFFEKLDKMSGQKRTSLLNALLGEGFDDEVARMIGGKSEIQRNLDLIQEKNKYQGSIAGISEEKIGLLESKLKLLGNSLKNLKDNVYSNTSGPTGTVVDAITGTVNEANRQIDIKTAAEAYLDKHGITASDLQARLPPGTTYQDAVYSAAVNAGYNMDKQVIPMPVLPTEAPAFPPDVPVPMPAPRRGRPDRPRRGFNLPPIQYPEQAPYFPLSGEDYRRADSGGDANRLEFLAAAAGEKLEDGGDKAGRAVADGGKEAAGALIDAAGIIRSAVAGLQGLGASIRGAINADTGRSGVETEARNFVP